MEFDVNYFVDEILNISTEELEEKIVDKFGFKKYGTIFYYGNSNAPIFLFAHLDTYNTKRFGKIFEKYLYPLEIEIENEKIIKLNKEHNIYYAVLGGDDRCGVYLLLLLKSIFNDKLFYILQNDEENNSYITKKILNKDITNNKILITIDADANKVIKSYIKNNAFLKFINILAQKYNMILKDKKEYNFCIIDYLGDKYYDAINVGCGFSKQHTENEYIDIEKMENSFLFLNELINIILNNYAKA